MGNTFVAWIGISDKGNVKNSTLKIRLISYAFKIEVHFLQKKNFKFSCNWRKIIHINAVYQTNFVFLFELSSFSENN